MTNQSMAIAPAITQGWHDYQVLLVKALAPLAAEQLALRAAPSLRSIGENATHMIGARARWFNGLMGEGDAAFAAMGTWDRKGMPVRSAAELVQGLQDTWQVMQAALARWTPDDLQHLYEGKYGDEPYSLSRGWVIWHLIEHDLHHGGEISLTLGIHGLTAPDL
ncbi:MAG: DinB family protein [Chloroflexi bacterium]|nr:DinB family protein [Chloroflexota bacterium]